MSLDLIHRFPALSPEDALQAQEAMWALLRRQARLYAPESFSLPTETAAALAESILLTLGADRDPPAAESRTYPPSVADRLGHPAGSGKPLPAGHPQQPETLSGPL